MKNRLFFQKVMSGLAVLTAFMIAGCNMDILNELRNPEEFYAKKGGLMIYNLSTSDDIQQVEVKDVNGDLVEDIIVQGDEKVNLLPIPKEEARGIVLDPGTYSITVKYPNGTSPAAKKVTIEWKKNTAEYFSNGATTAPAAPYGILQIINFSRVAVTSVKDGGTELLPTGISIEDKSSYSVSKTPGTYTIEVKIASASAYFTKQVQIKAGDVTTITVTETGLSEGIPVPVAESNNLWVLNRIGNGSAITKVEKQRSGASYGDLPNSTIPDGGYLGARLDPATYDFRITLGEPSSTTLTKLGIMLTSSDPVFLIVQINLTTQLPEIVVVTPGDDDNDGFPDWWEREHFGPDAVKDPNVPPKDGDPDGDGLTNEEEYFYGTNPVIPDSDGDGLTDWEEINGKRDPNYPDNLRPTPFPTDTFPETFPPTNPLNPDSDGDGYSDYVEIRDGSDPQGKTDIPRWGTTIVVPWGT